MLRLAHCSDLHLLSHEGAGWLDYANKRWIGAMNLLSNRSRHHHLEAFDHLVDDVNQLGVDHMLCTGDVTNLAMAREFAFARAQFDRFNLGPTGVTVVPGNHDAYVAEGVAHFAEAFAPYATADDGWGWPAEAADTADPDRRWPIVRIRGELALIGLTTSRATPWFTAYGRVGPGQLARLRTVLADPRLAGKARVVAIHHPCAGRRAENRIRGLRDHAAFAAVIAEVGAEVILHGHEHRDMRESLPGPRGPVPVLGVCSGTYEAGVPARTARYRILEIEGGKLRSDHCRVWHRDRKAFERDDLASTTTAASA
jgi:3',5'-cyclic AMP phosphodiesterase CpdA